GNPVILLECHTGGPSYTTTVRVDHVLFNNLQGIELYAKNIVGVVDHNTFLSTPPRFPMHVDGSYWNNDGDFGDSSWASSINYSDSNWLFVENNTFTVTGGSWACNDARDGARVVFRFNITSGCLFNQHGTESGQRHRGTRAVQIYKNSMDFTGAQDR